MPEVGVALLVIATNNQGGKLQQSGKTQTGWQLRVKQVGWGYWRSVQGHCKAKAGKLLGSRLQKSTTARLCTGSFCKDRL